MLVFMNKQQVLSSIELIEKELSSLRELITAGEVVVRKPKTKIEKGALDCFQAHREVLEKVTKTIQQRWVDQYGVIHTNAEIWKCRDWCLANNRRTQNWSRRINTWLSNSTPVLVTPKSDSLLVSK